MAQTVYREVIQMFGRFARTTHFEDGDRPVPALSFAVAHTIFTIGAAASLEYLRSSDRVTASARTRAAGWVPIVLGAIAGAAHIATRPDDFNHQRATRILDRTVAATGAAFVIADAVRRGRGTGAVAALAFASAGLLGEIVALSEAERRETESALVRRARIVERLVPQRNARLDRIVVHV